MNKQEVINEIEKIDYQNLKYNSPERMLSEQKQLIIDIIDKLDELQKVKVPECVGELLDYYRKSADVDLLALLICFKDWYFRNDKTSESEEAIDWLVKHPEKFMKAWIDGYEVDEERKWVVKIEDNGSAYFVDFFDELQPHLVYGLSGEVMRFDSEDKANAIVTLIECGTVEKV
ncbi:DUF1642 domain-containing protein [Enterococcus avium]|uniref:DUF1642 domain-containing protein n=1 Tax=Enterococcus avium TaxID=33945 RepID=UPI003DA4D203